MVVEYKIPKERMRVRTPEQTALDVAFRKRMRKIRKKAAEKLEDDPNSGVVFLSNLPHAFCEYAMFKYFSQFGRIKRVRLSRSKKSAKSKGFAYVEFEYAEVAKIAAETMNNYLMYRKLIKCKVVPKEELHADTFKGCFRRFGKPRGRMNSIRRNNSYATAGAADTERICRTLQRRAKQEDKKERLLKEMGIDFQIDGYRNELNAVKDKLQKAGTTPETQKNESVVGGGEEEDKADSKKADSVVKAMDVKETSSKETEEPSSSVDVRRKSQRTPRSSIKKDAAEGDEKETTESLNVEKRKRTRSRRGGEDEKPSEEEEEAGKTPVTRAKAQDGKTPVTRAKAQETTGGRKASEGKTPVTRAKAQDGKTPVTRAKAQDGKTPVTRAKAQETMGGGKTSESAASGESSKKGKMTPKRSRRTPKK